LPLLILPPTEAIADNHERSDAKKIKVQPLSDEDRRTLVRWSDLDFDAAADRM